MRQSFDVKTGGEKNARDFLSNDVMIQDESL